jgi:hypothetical protein
MGLSAPLPHQGRAALQRSAGIERTSAFLELSRQNPQAALQGGGRAAMGALLQLVDDTPDDQIATEPQRRAGVMQRPPRTPQLLRRPIDQPGNLTIKRMAVRISRPVLPAVCTETGGRLARVLASRSVVDWKFRTSAGRLILAVLGGLADVERDLIHTRTARARSRAKAQRQQMGRPPPSK